MDSIYLISLIVGGFFVLLSIFGGDHEADSDVDLSLDADADFEVDFDGDFDADFDHDLELDGDADHDFSLAGDGGIGFVDLLSVRALFLFAAFFGLTGTTLELLGGSEPLTAVLAVLVGLTVGLGGNWIIKRFAYEQVSSAVGTADYKGRTAQVMLPFEGAERGKILLEVKGQRVQLPARQLDVDRLGSFDPGEEVVVVRMDGRVAEVVKPN